MQIMTPNHAQWDTFRGELRKWVYHEEYFCIHNTNRPCAKGILRRMGFDNASITASLNYFADLGCHCDCEIFANLNPFNLN